LPIEERAAIAATVTGEGIENVAEDKLGILEPLRANLVLAQAGAQFLTGLIGDVSIPVYSGSNVTWKGETSTAADGAGTMSEVSLTPKRLTAYVDVSKQFLLQDSNAADQMLMNDLVMAITNKLEATILGLTAGSTTQPAGIFNGVTADTAAITFSDIVTMETNLENNNVYGNIAYIVNPSAKATLKTTAKATGTAQFLMEDNEIDGLPVYSTSSVTSKGVLIGNFADYVIGQWGGIDLTVDPYSQAANGNVRLVVNAYFDAKPRRSASFGVKILA
jgi:HK97 family phage major capsid protein